MTKKEVQTFINKMMTQQVQNRRANGFKTFRGCYLGVNALKFAPVSGYTLEEVENKPLKLIEARQNILFFAQYFQDLAQGFYNKVVKNKTGFTFYIKDRYSDILELYTSALLKAEKIGEKFRNFDEVSEYIEKCKKNVKKWDMLARLTLSNEKNARASYGWTWWELEEVGDRFQLVNTYESNGERFTKIKETKQGDYVGEYAEEIAKR